MGVRGGMVEKRIHTCVSGQLINSNRLQGRRCYSGMCGEAHKKRLAPPVDRGQAHTRRHNTPADGKSGCNPSSTQYLQVQLNFSTYLVCRHLKCMD